MTSRELELRSNKLRAVMAGGKGLFRLEPFKFNEIRAKRSREARSIRSKEDQEYRANHLRDIMSGGSGFFKRVYIKDENRSEFPLYESELKETQKILDSLKMQVKPK